MKKRSTAYGCTAVSASFSMISASGLKMRPCSLDRVWEGPYCLSPYESSRRPWALNGLSVSLASSLQHSLGLWSFALGHGSIERRVAISLSRTYWEIAHSWYVPFSEGWHCKIKLGNIYVALRRGRLDNVVRYCTSTGMHEFWSRILTNPSSITP